MRSKAVGACAVLAMLICILWWYGGETDPRTTPNQDADSARFIGDTSAPVVPVPGGVTDPMSTVLTGALRIIVHSAECGPIESVFCHSNATGLLADTVYDDEMLSEVVFADLPLGEYWIAATGHLGECLAEGLVVLAGPETQVELKLQPIEAADESGLSLLVECDSSPLSGETVGLRLLYA